MSVTPADSRKQSNIGWSTFMSTFSDCYVSHITRSGTESGAERILLSKRGCLLGMRGRMLGFLVQETWLWGGIV